MKKLLFVFTLIISCAFYQSALAQQSTSDLKVRLSDTIGNRSRPLSFQFISFAAQQVKNAVLLNWQTATEQNNRGFEIQRKGEGEEYKTIAFVPARNKSGNSSQMLAYSYDDVTNISTPGQVFYRVRQVGLDGNSSSSEIRFVNYNLEETTVLVYPNPANGFSRIVLPTGAGEVDMTILNTAGSEVRRWNGVVNQLLIDDLHPGIYTLKIVFRGTGMAQAHKLILL